MPNFTGEQFSERVQDHLSKYITLADQKASILLTGQIAFLGLSATAVSDLINPANSNFWYLSAGTAFVGIAGALLAIMVIYPRKTDHEKGFIYWEHILAHGSVKNYQTAFEALSNDDVMGEMMQENYILAKIADKKYRYLRWSLRATVLMIILSCLAGATYAI